MHIKDKEGVYAPIGIIVREIIGDIDKDDENFQKQNKVKIFKIKNMLSLK